MKGPDPQFRCRVQRSRRFPILDRIRFLFTGVLYITLTNAKAHTQTMATVSQPMVRDGSVKWKPGANMVPAGLYCERCLAMLPPSAKYLEAHPRRRRDDLVTE